MRSHRDKADYENRSYHTHYLGVKTFRILKSFKKISITSDFLPYPQACRLQGKYGRPRDITFSRHGLVVSNNIKKDTCHEKYFISLYVSNLMLYSARPKLNLEIVSISITTII